MASQHAATINDSESTWPSGLAGFETSLSPELWNAIVLGTFCFLGASWIVRSIFVKLNFSVWAGLSLDNLKLEDEISESIYKFQDKYNLTMGLKKTTINTITRMDQQYRSQIEARAKVLAQYPGALGYVDSGIDMLNELYKFLFAYFLPTRYLTMFHLDAITQTLHNLVLDEHIPLRPPADHVAALRHIALAVDEDFLMLLPAPNGDGYSLQAFVWLYPVGFDPQSKLGVKLRDAHAPVPGYGRHLEMSMDRYFAKLEPGRVVDRVNWAVANDSSLCERGEYHLYADDQVPETTEVDLEDTWVRCELQTLFALPGSGGKVLSVHLYLYPLREIKEVGLGEQMCRAIDGYGAGNAGRFSRYKRVPVWGDAVKSFFEELSW